MIRLVAPFLALATLSACAGGSAIPQPTRPATRPTHASPLVVPVGLEAVIGKDRATLERMFGTPIADTLEVEGRKLQWAGAPCILDAYLYADGRNGAEIAVHVDARRSDGAAVDRAACVAALARR